MKQRIQAIILSKTTLLACLVSAGLLVVYVSAERVDAAPPVLPQSSAGLLNLIPTTTPLTHTATQAGSYGQINRTGYAIGGSQIATNTAECGNAPNLVVGSLGSIDRSSVFYSMLNGGDELVLNMMGQQYLKLNCDATWGTCAGETTTAPKWLKWPNAYDYQCRSIPSTVDWQ